jgi:uncharacterized protein (DUF362 family)
VTSLDPRTVYVVGTSPDYAEVVPVSAPELPSDALRTPALAAVRKLLQTTGLDSRRFSSSTWNPLGDIIGRGDRVLIKPNLVHHENASGAGLDCLVTHSTIMEAVLEYVARAQPESIIVGDAPIQSCDFPLLSERTGLDAIFPRARCRGIPVDFRDFRLVTMQGRRGGPTRQTERNPDQYVLFDLGTGSFLEPISGGSPRFRVTMYDPQALESTHGRARHRYLIAREVMDSNVVINLPKLKTHKKACITGALKNVVGINGHKGYLPHHRRGGSADGGDCYSGHGLVKSLAEEFLDRGNRSSPGVAKRFCNVVAHVAIRAGRATIGSSFDLEGSWHGNDTVWRTVLDLQRILHYGRPDGTVAACQQRTVINLTDAIVGGQGEGPLSPIPASLRFLTLGINAPATEWVNAILMGLDPARIPLTSAAFSNDEPSLANFQPDQIMVRLGNSDLSPEEAAQRVGYRVLPPANWVGHCEWQPRQASAL